MSTDSLTPEPIAVQHASAMPDLTERLAEVGDLALAGIPLPRTLEELGLQVRRDLDLIQYPMKSWVLPKIAPDGSKALDVLIIGAGQAGLATAFGLIQQRVMNILAIDENEEGREGPWGVYARMETLRTQKDVGGIESGVPSLSLRAWYEVQYGLRSWEQLYKIPTDIWRRYLDWYRDVIGIPVRNGCRMIRFGPSPTAGLLEVEIEDAHGVRGKLWAKMLVLATGIEGNGARHVPDYVASIPKSIWAHTHEFIDFEALAGKHVAVLGGGASAFDNAILAAEAGAQRVDLYHRTPLLRPANAMAWGEFNGYLAHFPDLPIEERWRFTRQMRKFRGGPPLRTIARAERAANLTIHAGVTWHGLGMQDDRPLVHAADGDIAADFLIFGTGYKVGMELRSEFAEHVDKIALWRDVFSPPESERDDGLLRACYLGPNFETLEKQAGCAPWLASVFNFSHGANLSMGAMSIGLSGIKFGIPRLIHGVTKKLFVDDSAAYFEGMKIWQQSENVYEP